MTLTGGQIQQIRDAILWSYSSQAELSNMVRLNLDANLEAIAGFDDLGVVVFNLVMWAERRGCVDTLIFAALRQKPDNPELRSLLRELIDVDIFLSYSPIDTEAMRQVRKALFDAGFSVWTSEGLNLDTTLISLVVSEAKVVVVLLSPEAKRSELVHMEVGYATDQEKRIFPILLRGDMRTAVPIDLIGLQLVDGRENLHLAVSELMPALTRMLDYAAAPSASVTESIPPPRWPLPRPLRRLATRREAEKVVKSRLTLSLSHTGRIAKGHSSPFIVIIYPSARQTVVDQKLRSTFGDRAYSEWKTDTMLTPGLSVVVELSSRMIEFSPPTKVVLTDEPTKLDFDGRPKDDCMPGEHTMHVSIRDAETDFHYMSESIFVQVDDYAFDHVSRPKLQLGVAAVTAIAAAALWLLTFLGKVDTAMGLASGSAAAAVSAFLLARLQQLYQTASSTTRYPGQP